MSRFAFGPFLLDTEARALLRDGERLPLAGRTLDTLIVLVQNRGRLLEKDELLSLIWPGTVVEESNLSQSIFTLRKLLGDSPKHNRYIATVAGRGYQFVAPSTELPAETPPVHLAADTRPAQETQPPVTTRVESPPLPKSSPFVHRRIWTAVSALVALVVFAAAIFFLSHRKDVAGTRLGLWLREIGIGHRPASQTAISERRLTANPFDTPVTSGVISPDGKFLAYTDATGLYLRQVDNGETHPIALPKGIDPRVESWFPDRVHLLASWADNPEKPPGLWQISVVGGAVRKVIDEGSSASLSPDGSHIVFVRQAESAEELWLMEADGANARKLIRSLEDSFSRAAWAPDGNRLAYARTKTRYYASRRAPETQIEVFDLSSGHAVVVVAQQKDRGLPRGGAALGWTPDGRLIYPRRDPPPNQHDTNLWRVRLDPRTAHPVGPSTRITSGRGIAVQLSLSNDGERVALRRHAPQTDVYIADLTADGKRLSPPRLLTLDERLDYATAWTADSKAVVFYSNRDGPFHVFKQAIDTTQPELLAGGKADLYLPRLSPDGSSVIYVVRTKPGGSSDNAQLMRVPLSGGPPQFVLEAPNIFDVECAQLHSNLCIYGQTQAGKERFFTFDPVKGRGVELSALASAHSFNWSMSPNGKYFAWPSNRTTLNQPGVQIFSIEGEWKRDIAVPGWADIYGLDWAPDCKGLWACARDTKGNSALLNLDLDGKVRTMLFYPNLNLLWAIPSPDGRRLAIVEERNTSNMFLLENF